MAIAVVAVVGGGVIGAAALIDARSKPEPVVRRLGGDLAASGTIRDERPVVSYPFVVPEDGLYLLTLASDQEAEGERGFNPTVFEEDPEVELAPAWDDLADEDVFELAADTDYRLDLDIWDEGYGELDYTVDLRSIPLASIDGLASVSGTTETDPTGNATAGHQVRVAEGVTATLALAGSTGRISCLDACTQTESGDWEFVGPLSEPIQVAAPGDYTLVIAPS